MDSHTYTGFVFGVCSRLLPLPLWIATLKAYYPLSGLAQTCNTKYVIHKGSMHVILRKRNAQGVYY